MDFAIMDNKGIIETFNSLEEAINNIDRVRKNNDNIYGALKVIEIHFVFV